MRKLSGIFFLCLMLLSTFGYLQFLTMVERQYFYDARERIDGNENEISGNMLLRLPLEGPYGTDDREYVPVQGEVTVEGQLYHLLKKKVYRDTLYILCLEDKPATEARKAVADYSQSMADQSPAKPGPAKKKTEVFSIIYILSGTASRNAPQTGYIRLVYGTRENLYRSHSLASVFHPPCLFSSYC